MIAFISRHDCVYTQLLFFLYLITHIIRGRCYLRLSAPIDTAHT